jgi:hypothetical protein
VVEDFYVGCMVFRFEELFYHQCFEGGAEFSSCQGFYEFSNDLSDVCDVLSEVEDGVNVYP